MYFLGCRSGSSPRCARCITLTGFSISLGRIFGSDWTNANVAKLLRFDAGQYFVSARPLIWRPAGDERELPAEEIGAAPFFRSHSHVQARHNRVRACLRLRRQRCAAHRRTRRNPRAQRNERRRCAHRYRARYPFERQPRGIGTPAAKDVTRDAHARRSRSYSVCVPRSQNRSLAVWRRLLPSANGSERSILGPEGRLGVCRCPLHCCGHIAFHQTEAYVRIMPPYVPWHILCSVGFR